MKRSPIRKVRKKPRPGRLKGKALEALRLACFRRDSYTCLQCHTWVYLYLPHEHDVSAHMAHIKAKRIGLDTLSNVRTLCGKCHRLEHAFGKSMRKPCPKKPVVSREAQDREE